MRNLRREALVTVHTLTAILPLGNRRDITTFVSIGSVVMMSGGGVAKLWHFDSCIALIVVKFN